MATDHLPRDTPFNEAQTVDIAAGEQATLSYELSNTRSEFHLVMAAISKFSGVVYELDFDGSDDYQASIPPTDIDNAQATYIPPKTFQNSMTVRVSNVGSVDRTVSVQIKGWERPPTVDEGGL